MDQEPFILIVDGELGSANLLKLRLDSTGYKTGVVANGKDVFLKFVDRKPDVMVINAMLPDMSGQEVHDHMREYPEWNDTQVIFIANSEKEREGLDEGGNVLTKPYDPKDLIALLETAVQNKTTPPETSLPDTAASGEPGDQGIEDPSEAEKVKAETSADEQPAGDADDGKLKEPEEDKSASEINLKEKKVPPEIIEKIPPKFVWHYKFVPVDINDNVLTVATSRKNDIALRDDLRQYLGFIVKTRRVTEDELEEAITKYYGVGGQTVDQIYDDTAGESLSESMDMGDGSEEDIAKMAEDASVIKLVNQVLIEANEKGATDIHIEPYEGKLKLRYRIDGILVDTKISQNMVYFLPAIISRIKIMSGLNIVEKRLPQDGRANVTIKDEKFDLRVSTIPTGTGESIVIRVLPTKMIFDLKDIGFFGDELKKFEELIKRPNGVIFVTGPTGSGKSTTLYAALTKIKNENAGTKIITIEDPIEYQLEGITQVQVNPEIEFTFARGLRSFLRHDPDIMMVGEVRDHETAEIAMRMALTGHLLFSTLHTNDAASGVTRLLDIGIEPYLVSTSVITFLAQRLIRTICPDCKEEVEKNLEIINEIETLRGEISQVREKRDEEQKLTKKSLNSMRDKKSDGWLREGEKCYRGKGCDECNQSGYKGRTAIFELLVVSDEIKKLINKKVPAEDIRRQAIKEGMRTMFQIGFDKVVKGETSFEEILRVVKEEEMV